MPKRRSDGWCPSGKVRIADEDGAMLALSRARQHRPKGARIERRYYQCDQCGGWHLTSVPQR